jgi:hypothetical protein
MPVCVSASQAHSRVPNFNFDIEDGSFFIICKIPNCKVLAHLGFKSKVLAGPFADLSVCVGFCTSSHSSMSNINFDIGGGPYRYFIFK